MADEYPRNEESEKVYKQMQADCTHDGGFSDVKLNTVLMQTQMIVLTANSCNKCGHVIINSNVVPLGPASSITVPQIKLGGGGN